MEIIDGVKVFEAGDIAIINGKKYYCEQSPKFLGCELCSFRGRNQCYKWFDKHGIGGCVENNFYFITVNRVIKREEKKIRESQKLINKLSK